MPDIHSSDVGRVFGELEAEYDLLYDLWYSWIFARLHFFIAEFLATVYPANNRDTLRCVDIGCGTGFQSFLYALCGMQVIGIDIAHELLRVAKEKDGTKFLKENVFRSPFQFAHEYWQATSQLCDVVRRDGVIGSALFVGGDATEVPIGAETADIVNCCGPTLSFIERYEEALREMRRVLRPGGWLVLEVENRFSLDLLWAFGDALTGGHLGYGQNMVTAARNVVVAARRHVKIQFPLSTHGEDVWVPLWLFSRRQLMRELRELNFRVFRTRGIHIVTNLLPSVWLDEARPSEGMRCVFEGLAGLEERVEAPLKGAGSCSLVVFAQKLVD